MILKNIKEKNKEEIVLYLDATGKLVRPPTDLCSVVLIYALVAAITVNSLEEKTDPFPMTELVSSSHYISTIGGWLRLYRLELEKIFQSLACFQYCGY